MADMINNEIEYYDNLNNYINKCIEMNYHGDTLNINSYDHWLLTFEYKGKKYFIFIYDYHERINICYNHINHVLKVFNITFKIIAKFSEKYNPYASILLINYLIAGGTILKYSKLNKYVNNTFVYKVRILFIPIIHDMELAIKLKLLYNDVSLSILSHEDLSKRYNIYIFTKYKHQHSGLINNN